MRLNAHCARLCLSTLAVLALAACGGGNSVPVSPLRIAPATSPASVGTKVTQAVSIRLPGRSQSVAASARSRAKKREYVSASTTGVLLNVTDSTAGSSQTLGFDVSPQPDANSSCGATQSDGSRVCTLGIPVVAGDSVTVTASIYDKVPSPLGIGATAAGNELAAGTSAATTVVANQANTIAITLKGFGAGLEPLVYGTQSVASFRKVQQNLTFHVVDLDGNPIDAIDPNTAFQSPMTLTIADAGDTSGCTTRCAAFNYALSATTATIDSPQNAGTNDETPQLYLNFAGGDDSPPISNGTGDEISTPPYYAELSALPATPLANNTQAGLAIVAPLFAFPTGGVAVTNAAAGYAYADQYMLPSGSAGYSMDASNCTGMLSAGPAASAAYGAKFALTGITNGSCSVTLSDGVSADSIAEPVSVSGFATSPVTLVGTQSATGGSTGAAVNSVNAKLPAAPAVGNTVLLIVAQGLPSAQLDTVGTPAGFTSVANNPSFSTHNGFAVFAKDVTNPASDQSVTVAFPTGVTGAISYYIAEYHNTHASLVSSVNEEYGQTISPGSSSSPPPVTPDAPNAYLVTGATANIYGTLAGADPYTDSTGFKQSYAPGGTSALPTATDSAALEIQTEPLTSQAAVTNSFAVTLVSSGSTAQPTTADFIFYLRPAM